MAPFGLTEPIFVPEYWNPPSLIKLAQRTGFDIESIIFSFAIGGNVAYGNYFAMPKQGRYEIVVNVRRPGHRKTATARFQYWHPRR